MNIDSMKILEITSAITMATINHTPDKDLDKICETLKRIYNTLINLLNTRTEGK